MRYILIFCAVFLSCSLFSDVYQEAFEAYQLGERASSIDERAKHFNKALSLYSENEFEDGKLYYNIANCYYQLNQLGMAIWYYTKAQSILPRDSKVEKNLKEAQRQAQTPTSPWESVLKSIFFFHYKLKLSEKKLIFLALSLLLTLLISLVIWQKKTFIKPMIFIFTFAFCLFGLSLAKEHMYKNEALVIQPTLLRCDGGKQYKEVDEMLTSAGERCQVLEVSPDNQWVKIKTASGKKGYALSSHIRFIS